MIKLSRITVTDRDKIVAGRYKRTTMRSSLIYLIKVIRFDPLAPVKTTALLLPVE